MLLWEKPFGYHINCSSEAVRAAHGLLRRALTQKLLLMLRAVGGTRGRSPRAPTWGTPQLCPAEGFCKEGKVCSSPGSMLLIEHSVKGPILPGR